MTFFSNQLRYEVACLALNSKLQDFIFIYYFIFS